MTLDLTQLTSQLEAQLADLSKQRTEIQKELDAILLVERASHRADSLPPEQKAFPPPVDPEPIPPVTVQPEERPVQEDEAPVEEPAAEPVEAGRGDRSSPSGGSGGRRGARSIGGVSGEHHRDQEAKEPAGRNRHGAGTQRRGGGAGTSEDGSPTPVARKICRGISGRELELSRAASPSGGQCSSAKDGQRGQGPAGQWW